jgi:glutaredoxin
LLTIYLYTTSACHLCDSAIALLTETNTSFEVIPIEIANDDQLILQYGTRIPVLKRDDTQLELAWPFNLSDINAFVS